MATVSVAMATFNGERYLRLQLETIAAQTVLPDELIISDDRSTDATLEIAHSFARVAPFPVQIHSNQHRLDFRLNFYSAINACAGDIVFLADQDDLWKSTKIDLVTRVFDDKPQSLLVYHQATVIDAAGQSLGPMSDSSEQALILTQKLPPPWHFARGLVQAFRRDLLDFDDLISISREHFCDSILAHDRWYFLLALALRRIAFLDEDLLSYRQHGANAFGADLQGGLADRIRARLAHSPVSDAYAAAGASSRACVLEKVAARAPPEEGIRLIELATEYRIYSDRLKRRNKTYCAESSIARLRTLMDSIQEGDYRGNPWGFDARSIVRDLWSGVILGRLL